jgi:hypothetical protein
MFYNKEAKIISIVIRKEYKLLIKGIRDAFEKSIAGCNKEVIFIKNLTTELNGFFSKTNIPGLSIKVRTKAIHQRPIVSMNKGQKCELGDLLVVIKYNLPSGIIEAKSIIYQVKLTSTHSSSCFIDQTQLNLLCNWTIFHFGKNNAGGSNIFNISPTTLEFGSFMLEQRNPALKQYLPCRHNKTYGLSPCALMVDSLGPKQIDLNNCIYTRTDINNFFSHVVFEIGENHSNQTVKNLVDALYRYIGLAPDPCDEFVDFCSENDDDGFGLLEINFTLESFEKSQHGG